MVIICLNHQLSVHEMRCLRSIRGQTDYKISRSERTPLHLNLSQMSPDIEDSFGHVFRMQRGNIVRQACKQDFKGHRKRGRQLKRWSDQIRNDAGSWSRLFRKKLKAHDPEREGINKVQQDSWHAYLTHSNINRPLVYKET